MGEYRQGVPINTSEPEKTLDDVLLGTQRILFESQWLQEPDIQSPDIVVDLQDRVAAIATEKMVPEELLPEVRDLMKALEQDVRDNIPEISQLTITEKSTTVSRNRRRLCELARRKTRWQRDRPECCCKGYAWVSPRKMTLQFCLYWPSIYWNERFHEDTTLTITVPAVSRRVEELSQPKKITLECYRNKILPRPLPSIAYHPTNRLKELAIPKVRNNIWTIDMSELSKVSRAAQMAVPSARILHLAKPKGPPTVSEEWDPMPKPKAHMSDYNRLLQLAMPKAQSEKCIPDRSPRWEVLDVTKRAVASERIITLAQPKIRKDINEGYNPYQISPASLVARASPRIYELAIPKSITKKV
ncbi:testicular haploid expressed gene protein-like [Dipodomys spectabilis]|uniref:testicular haploid expressed gene protein-like n=1 Tax=Dipodomys spectabilis TaxID=105255 RepID=UPI001C546D27|nr:testicular haploid expressed gene protein-like [Dipodomys spectabilis]